MEKKSKRVNKFTTKMQKKLVILFIMVLLAFVGLSARLILINKENGEKYKKQVLSQQQYDSRILPYKRGDIIDAKGTPIAMSEKVYNLIIDCKMLLEKKDYLEPTMKALKKYFPIDESEVRAYIAANPSSQYYSAAKKLSYEEISPFVELQADTEKNPNIQGVWFEEEYRRIYPYNSLACDVLGFTSKDNVGTYGLESYYNDVLNGLTGREYGYLTDDSTLERTTKPAVDGNTIVTSIDVNIQGIVEKKILELNESLKDGVREGNGSKNTGVILMDPNTGEVKAMASYPTFDLNNPKELSAEAIEAYKENKTDAEKKETAEDPKTTEDPKTADDTNKTQESVSENAAVSQEKLDEDEKYEALNSLWKNFCIADSYEPGSTAKPFTVSAAIDSGKITGNETYQCNGFLTVGDYDIKCHNRFGDGPTTVKQSIEKSCNVALMHIGFALGADTYMDYQGIFNFGLKTNIDLAGEARTDALMFDPAKMVPTDTAVASFGQGYNVTMIQQIAAFASLINGGYYYQPHVVSKIISAEGSTVKNIEPRVLKQTISATTSETIVDFCNSVVTQGTGVTARPAGYTMGGKTGTAQTLPRGNRQYVISFMGYVPADDPQILIYVVIDRPNVADQANSTRLATVLAKDIMTEVLPYMNIFPTEELTEKELKAKEEADAQKAADSVSANAADGESVSGNETNKDTETDTKKAEGTTESSTEDTKPEIEIDKETGYAIDPNTGEFLDPVTGAPIDSGSGDVPAGLDGVAGAKKDVPDETSVNP